jgi:hypothetical protein
MPLKTILRHGPDRREYSQIRALGNMQGVLLSSKAVRNRDLTRSSRPAGKPPAVI